MAQKRDLNFDEGDGLNYKITIKDSDGNAIDITGYTFYFTCKRKQSDPDYNAIFKKEITNIEDPTLGIVVITITKEDTLGKTPGIYPYDICWIDNGGVKRTILEGRFNLSKAITEDF